MHVRRTNGFNAHIKIEKVPADHEMAALDDLGPMTRKVLVDGPLSILAVSIVSQIIEFNDNLAEENTVREQQGLPLRPYLDPKSPELDRRLALGALQLNVKLMAADRHEEDAKMGLKPLVARPSARTARERRKTEGRRFRGW
jgi:hypothetical protein